MVSFLRLGLLCISLLAVPAASPAGEFHRTNLDAPAPGSGSVRLADLARVLAPDLRKDGDAWRAFRLEETLAADLGLDSEWPEGLSLTQAILAEPDHGTRLAVLFDLGAASGDPATPALLALYRTGDTPELLGVLDVGLDRETGLDADALQPLGDGADLITVRNGHFNSEQSYSLSTLLLATADGLEVIDDIATFSETFCGLRRTQEPRITVERATGVDPAPIRVEFLLRDEVVEGSCEEETPALPERKIGVTYRWDAAAARYEPDSQALEDLAAENEKSF
jgi:hypothetical protein